MGGGKHKQKKTPSSTSKEKQHRVKYHSYELDRIIQSLYQKDPIVITSKPYIHLSNGNETYRCSLCNTIIVTRQGQELYQIRYEIYAHINENYHKKNLPDYEKLALKDLEDLKKELSELVSEELLSDLHCFEIGPVFGYLKCNICNCAVSRNALRLRNHLTDKDHLAKKQGVPATDTVAEHNELAFKAFISGLPEELKSEEQYLIKGCIPGYIICSLCCCPIVPNMKYLNDHVNDTWHQKNKLEPFYLTKHSKQVLHYNAEGKRHRVGVFYMKLLLSILQSDDHELKDSSKYLFKQFSSNVYSCTLCNESFRRKSVDEILMDIVAHVRGERHKKNVVSGIDCCWSDDCYDGSFLLEDIPIELYTEDASFFSVSEDKEGDFQISCSLCKYSFTLDLKVIINHVQSKDHVKNKMTMKLKNKSGQCATIDEVFEDVLEKEENLKLNKQFFTLSCDGKSTDILCNLCTSRVGSTSDTVGDLRRQVLVHIDQNSHQRNLKFYKKNTYVKEEEKKESCEKLLKGANLSEVDRSAFRLSKKQGLLKCRACKIRIPAESLLDHVENSDHKHFIAKYDCD